MDGIGVPSSDSATICAAPLSGNNKSLEPLVALACPKWPLVLMIVRFQIMPTLSKTVRAKLEREGLKPRNLVTRAECAEFMGCSEKTIDRLVANGKLTAYYITPRAARIDLIEVEHYLRSVASQGWRNQWLPKSFLITRTPLPSSSQKRLRYSCTQSLTDSTIRQTRTRPD